MENAGVWALAISALSLLIAILSYILNTRRFNILKRNEDERQAENKKATFRLEKSTVPSSGKRGYKDVLFVENIGKAEARNIEFFINDKPAGEHGLFFMSEVPSVLNPQNQVTINLMIHKQTTPPWKFEIRYEDDYANDRKYEAVIN